MSKHIKSKTSYNLTEKGFKDKQLNNEIEAMKTTINENLYTFEDKIEKELESTKEIIDDKKDEEINNLIKECEDLIEENIKSIDLIKKIKQEIHKKTVDLENYEMNINLENKSEILKNKKLQQKIYEQKKDLDKVLFDFNKIRTRINYRRKNKEIYIIEPYKKTLQLNNELVTNKKLLKEILRNNNDHRKRIKATLNGIELYTVMHEVYGDNYSEKDNRIEEFDLSPNSNKKRMRRSISFSG